MANERNNNQDDNKMGGNSPNQTMQHEQAKSSVSGSDRQSEKGEFNKDRQEKSAIGGGQSQTGQSDQGKDRAQTGEPGRARSELDDKSSSDKNRSEPPTGR